MDYVPGAFRFESTRRVIDPTVFIARTATLTGNVTIAAHASIWFGAVLRGDMGTITIGENSNIQDNAVVHVDFGFDTVIGRNVSVGHSAIVHGATIADNCIIGMHSTILNGATIGENCIIAAGALILEGQHVPANSVVMGMPGKVKKSADEKTIEHIRKNWEIYRDYARAYRHSIYHQDVP